LINGTWGGNPPGEVFKKTIGKSKKKGLCEKGGETLFWTSSSEGKMVTVLEEPEKNVTEKREQGQGGVKVDYVSGPSTGG